ncbi:RHS repeat domain-containing protein [Cytophaga aurantiaca]|uniref:RHS repeat domain-containing protein n=1 Tax=Cytophaga aurantiaca TaxID=29530 RepID=UPI0003756AE9|nr:hypothetical protein [Cytophaga aurantiaca]
MKQIILILAILLISFSSFSQEWPDLYNNVRSKFKFKSISVRVHSIEELKEYDSLEVSRIEYDKNGKVIYQKEFMLFDVMLYSEESKNKFNDKGQLIERIEIKTDYPQTKEDSSLLSFSEMKNPSTKKYTYEYDIKGNLIKVLEFLSAEDKAPALISVYTYNEDGKRIKGVFSHIKFPKQTSSSNRIEMYEYDAKGLLIQVKMNWTTSDVSSLKTIEYDSIGNKVFELIRHNNGSGNVMQYQYHNGRLMSIERFNLGQKKWFSKTLYEYSEAGYKIKEITKNNSGNESMETFEYNKQGLLTKEYWYTDTGKKSFSFETSYQFYE